MPLKHRHEFRILADRVPIRIMCQRRCRDDPAVGRRKQFIEDRDRFIGLAQLGMNPSHLQ